MVLLYFLQSAIIDLIFLGENLDISNTIQNQHCWRIGCWVTNELWRSAFGWLLTFFPSFLHILLLCCCPLHNSSREFSSLSFFKKALSGPPHHLLLDREGAIFLVSLKTHARKLTGYFCKNSTPPLLFLLLMKSTGPTSFFASKAFSILTYFKAIFSGMMKYDVDLS